MTRAVIGLIAAAAVLLAACSSPARPASTAPATNPVVHTGFNGNDVMFLQMMVPHDEQGRLIVRLAADRAASAEVRTLAAAIDATQADEVATMSGWLRAWGQPASAPAGSHAGHGGMPDTTNREIATLRRTGGPDFDRRFLNVLIAHQDDAIQLAKVEQTSGHNPDAVAMAERIDRSRSAQIQQMLRMLGQA
ncbi:MAG TPA: DUF305 domain-containing protein [Actinophytocola sp.]|uniref:DUF305 domain-containing protein n=1 Tax=Actinophytocola sp. TaxID=1872138 RepID=UPI002DBB2C19|nr:DUF305 domain-containing protein [Actinophytocola sp.]HEU5469350.1 DUF305 domain-containing protein [Actinophytocola sp.]